MTLPPPISYHVDWSEPQAISGSLLTIDQPCPTRNADWWLDLVVSRPIRCGDKFLFIIRLDCLLGKYNWRCAHGRGLHWTFLNSDHWSVSTSCPHCTGDSGSISFVKQLHNISRCDCFSSTQCQLMCFHYFLCSSLIPRTRKNAFVRSLFEYLQLLLI